MSIKWNEEIQEYESYVLPSGATLSENNMDAIIDCASCGQINMFGEAYTSLEIHTILGFGYSVCEACYNKEIERKKATHGSE